MNSIGSITSNNIEYPFGGTFANEGWSRCWLQISDTGAIASKGSYIIDLVEKGLLPDDGHDYEILLSMWNWTTATSGQPSSLWVFGGPDTGATRMRISMVASTPRTAATRVQCGGCVFPLIEGNRKLCVYNSGSSANSSWGLQIGGYRRLGRRITEGE